MNNPCIPWTETQFRDAVACASEKSARTQCLLDLLSEEHVAYTQCGSAEVARRRGWVYVELSKATLDPQALPFMLEELEVGHSPYLLSAAARALRQFSRPAPEFSPAVLRALDTLQRRDDVVNFSSWGGVPEGETDTTAMDEMLVTLRWLGSNARDIREGLQVLLLHSKHLSQRHCLELEQVCKGLESDGVQLNSDCCYLLPSWIRWSRSPTKKLRTHQIHFEDQDGSAYGWSDAFGSRPGVVAFFYTRCDNERKCSLTISNLREVQRLLVAAGINRSVHITAITYDPDFDLPHRLRGYAESRGLATDADCRVLRAIAGRDSLASYFCSGVNFFGTVVNRHRIELFVLDQTGQITLTHQRLEWTPNSVVDELKKLSSRVNETDAVLSDKDRVSNVATITPSLWALALALLPKCPICGATYLSVSGIAAFPYLTGWSQTWPALLLLLLFNFIGLFWLFQRSRRRAFLGWAGIGAALLIAPGMVFGSDIAMALGVGCTIVGSVLGVASSRRDLMRPKSVN